MMTLSIQSAVYQQSNARSSFDGNQLDQDRLNPRNQDFCDNTPVQTYPSSQLIPAVNLNAAIASSLKLKSPNPPSQMDSSINLLNKFISFHASPATPYDTLIKAHIEHMPNSTILLNSCEEKTFSPKSSCLFSDTDLIECCKGAQSALPRVNLGLRNAGNTCYLNSVLQCLLATGTLLHFVKENHSRPGVCIYANGQDGRRFCALCALFRLFQEHAQQNHTLISQPGNGFLARTCFGSTTPSFFASNVRAVCPNLRVYAQEDAHEYLLGLLSRMEDCVTTGLGKVPRSTLDTNVIRRIFGGVTRSEVTCGTCYRTSPRNDQWFNLSMDITHARSLQQCLVNYTQTEILQGANAYKCESCQQLRHARRCSRIFRAPPVLIVQFNRFSRSQKLDFHVDFPASFNMRPHMAPSTGPPVIYHLYATLNHEGFSCRSGHYVAFSKRRNQWFSHNDSIVTSTTQEYVLRQSPYLLFYQLASPEEVIIPRSAGSNDRQSKSVDKTMGISSSASQSGPKMGILSKNNTDVSSIPLPPGPTLPKPDIIFHPRVLTRTNSLPQGSLLPTSPKGDELKPTVVRVSTEGEAQKTSERPDSANGDKTADSKINGKPKSCESAAVAEASASTCHGPAGSTNASQSPDSWRRNLPKLANGISHLKQKTVDVEKNFTLSNNLNHNRNADSVSSNTSSSSSESTESSIEWVPVTKDDLMHQKLLTKRTYAECSSNRSSASYADEGDPGPSKLPKKESSEGGRDRRNVHHIRKHKKLKSHRRRHRHHRRQRHKRRRIHKYASF